MQVQQTPSLIPSVGAKPSSTVSSSVPDDPKLKAACKQFEGQFFALVLQEMQKTVPDDPEIGDDAHAQQIFQGMFDDNMAQEMAKHSGGANDLAEQMYRQLAQQHGAATGKTPALPQAALAGAALAVSAIKSSTESTENEPE